MNRKFKSLMALMIVASAQNAAWAAKPITGASEVKAEKEITMKDETLGFIPQYGAITFIDQKGETQGRQMAGLGIDFNFASLFKNNVRDYFLGVSTGAFYSHMGDSTSNFFGDNPSSNQGEGGANLVLIPVDAKIGYHFTPSFRGAVRGGGNIIYRSIARSAQLGDGSDSSNSIWKMYPNLGADFEWQLSNYVSVMARPDLTLAPNENLFMGTVGATIIMSL